MNKRRTIKLAAMMLSFLGVSIGIVHSNSTGPIAGRSGVPAGGGFEAEMTCKSSACHDDNRLNPDNRGRLSLTGLPDNYIPGQRFTITVELTHPDPDRRRWGFQVTPIVTATFLPAGEIIATERNTRRILGGPGGNRQYIGHNIRGVFTGQMGGASWNFDWVAPETNVGDVAFYGAGNAANANGANSGDKIFTPSPDPLARTKGQFSFTNIAEAANLAATVGGGVAIADFNNDGADDIFVAAGDQDLLFRNAGDGGFEDVTQAAGITADGAQGQAAAWGDFDGDGNVDLYLVNASPDALFRNNGDGTFTDVSVEAGVSSDAAGHSAAWGDVSGDGQLDVYVANEGQDVLYLNNGDGTFSAADPVAAGLEEDAAGWSVALADFNGDDQLDIFVANDGQDSLYRNNGDGTFTDVAAAAGIQTADANGRATAWADYDGDGDSDLFIANVGTDKLFRNNGDGSFSDVTAAAGLTDAAAGAGADWGDYDADGDPDLFVANDGQDFLYRNNGDGSFNQVAEFSGMADAANGQGAAWIDTDGDQNLDLFVSNAGADFLYQNPGQAGAAAARLARRGDDSGGSLIAAVIWLVSRFLT